MHHKGAGPSRPEWRTPEWVLRLARIVIDGPIELDPATASDNPTCAVRFYTKETNGLLQPWSADSVFLNPPWSRKLGLPIEPWLQRAHEAYDNSKLRPTFHMFVVTSAAVNAKWWHRHIAAATRHFFPLGRIAFVSPDLTAERDAPQFDAEVAYFGTDPDRFDLVFAPHGRVLR